MAATAKPKMLSDVPLFSACTRKELRLVSALSKRVRVPAGEVVVQEGSPGHDFFVVGDGKLKVTEKGRRVATLEGGDFFGEMSLLDLGPRTATVTAEDDSILFAISARDFTKLLDDVPIVARRVLAALSARLRQSRNAPSYRWNIPATSWNRR